GQPHAMVLAVRLARDEVLGNDECLARLSRRKIRVGEQRLGVIHRAFESAVAADLDQTQQRRHASRYADEKVLEERCRVREASRDDVLVDRQLDAGGGVIHAPVAKEVVGDLECCVAVDGQVYGFSWPGVRRCYQTATAAGTNADAPANSRSGPPPRDAPA